MQLKPHQLASHLKKSVLPVYFLTGDEPLQLSEMADLIRAAARDAGFTSRELFSADDHGFSWQQLIGTSLTSSIFADKQLLDLRLPSGSPGVDGAKALIHYCGQANDRTLMLITAGKLNKEAYKSRWFQALDKAGAVCQVWPLDRAGLLSWLEQRLLGRGLELDRESVKLLATKVEGNLPAAAQEVEKLFVLFGPGKLDGDQVRHAVVDNSRYDVYKLVDACLAADVTRLLKIFAALEQEEVPPPIIVWALSREARIMARAKWQVGNGSSLDRALTSLHVHELRKQLAGDCAKRLSLDRICEIIKLNGKADRQSKGQETGDAWSTLRQICLLFAGVNAGCLNLTEHS